MLGILKGGGRLLKFNTLTKLKALEASLKSGLHLELHFYTKTPVKRGQYMLNYKLEYGTTQMKWEELAYKSTH